MGEEKSYDGNYRNNQSPGAFDQDLFLTQVIYISSGSKNSCCVNLGVHTPGGPEAGGGGGHVRTEAWVG